MRVHFKNVLILYNFSEPSNLIFFLNLFVTLAHNGARTISLLIDQKDEFYDIFDMVNFQ